MANQGYQQDRRRYEYISSFLKKTVKNILEQRSSFTSWEIWDIMKKLDIGKELNKNVIMQINSFHFLGNLRSYEKIIYW